MMIDMRSDDATPRFLVDDNAARLDRWLRLIGYDSLYLPRVMTWRC